MTEDQTYLLIVRSSIVAISFVIALLSRRLGIRFHRAKALVNYLSHRPWTTAGLIVFLTLTINVSLAAVRYPLPWVHDEYSYLLASDTFAHGRLTNPVHPMWTHLETFHVLQQPSYASKYPPGTGVTLAIGQLLTGHPIVGVWLALSLACAALFWMFRAWLPAKWATLGGLLVAIHEPLHTTWGQSYWGGAVAMLGGALVFGGIRRVWKEPKVRDAALLAIGLVILANSRPMEGFIASVPVFSALLISVFRRTDIPWRKKLLDTVIPTVSIGGLGILMMLAYNHAVTGNILTLPYKLHDQTYSASSLLIWKQPPEIPEYNHERFSAYYVDWARTRQAEWNSPQRYQQELPRKLSLLSAFYPLAFGLCLPAIAFRLRDRWVLFALGTFLAVFAIELQLATSWIFPHYLAPVAGLIYLLNLQALRQLRVWKRQTGAGQVIASAVVLVVFLRLAAIPFTWEAPEEIHPRVAVEQNLQKLGDKHLVIVSYADDYTVLHEWVYNKANIDTSRIVWARDMGPAANHGLIDYFGDRKVWLWQLDADHDILRQYQDVEITANSTSLHNDA